MANIELNYRVDYVSPLYRQAMARFSERWDALDFAGEQLGAIVFFRDVEEARFGDVSRLVQTS